MEIIVNKNIPKKIFVILTIFGEVMGVFALYCATNCFLKVYILKTHNCTKATVISSVLTSTHSSGGETNYYRKVKYKYVVNEKEYIDEDTLTWRKSDFKLQKNDIITIYYNNNSPAESHVYHISYIFLIGGMLMVIFLPLALKERLKGE